MLLADLLFTDLNMAEAGVTSTAYTALCDHPGTAKTYSLKELVGKGSCWKFTLKKWDGWGACDLLLRPDH